MNNIKKNGVIESESEKISVNFHISLSTLEKIDDFLFYARKRLPMEKRRKLTKSAFYEIGLKFAIEDYNKKGEESILWKTIFEAMQD